MLKYLIWFFILGVQAQIRIPPGSTSGVNSGSGIAYTVFRVVNQNTIAGANFSIPASNAPTLISVEGTSSGDPTTLTSAHNFGTLSFAQNGTAATANSVEGTVILAPTWSATTGITVRIRWRSAATTGNVLWQLQGQCIATGGIPGTFNASKALTASTANGTTLHWTDTAVLTLSTSDALTGCTGAVAGTFLFRIFKDHMNGADTIIGTVELIEASFGVSQ